MIKIHPVFTDYSTDEFGTIYNIRFNRIIKGYIKKNGYISLTLMKDKEQKQYSAHKFIYECFNGLINLSNTTGEGLTINHIDENKINNSISNLEILSQRDNTHYSIKNKTSKYTGVHFNKLRKKYISSIKYKGVNIHLGSFDNDLEAALCYDNKYESLYKIRPNKTCIY